MCSWNVEEDGQHIEVAFCEHNIISYSPNVSVNLYETNEIKLMYTTCIDTAEYCNDYYSTNERV